MARRSLSEPVIYTGKLKALDKMNLKGKFENKDSGKIANIIFANQNDLLQAHPYLAKDTEMVFVGSPLIEFGSRNPTPVMYIFYQFWKLHPQMRWLKQKYYSVLHK